MSARQLEHVAAIDVDPFWLIISVTDLIAYGNTVSSGKTAIKARSASEAEQLSKKTNFKDWATLYNKKRINYEVSPLSTNA